MSFWKEYNEWKKTHRDEVQQMNMRKEMLKHPLNYTLLQNYMEAFFQQGRRDAILEVEGNGFKITVRYDDEGKTSLSRTEQILMGN